MQPGRFGDRQNAAQAGLKCCTTDGICSGLAVIGNSQLFHFSPLPAFALSVRGDLAVPSGIDRENRTLEQTEPPLRRLPANSR
jgi:hypothetical protein